MSLLTAAERAKLAEQGVYVREKCDECGEIILTEYTFVAKDKLTRCAKCYDKYKGRPATSGGSILEEAEKMAVKAKDKAAKKSGEKVESKKIFGVILPGTAIADLAEFLQDEKKHSIKDTLAAISSKHKADKMGRLKQLQRYGKQKNLWGVTIDSDAGTVQLKMGKGAASATVKAAPAAKKEKEDKPKAKEKAKPAKEEDSAGDDEVAEAPSKQQQSLQKLVRKALKGKDDWTENNLIDHLKEEHDLETKRIQAAIQAEIKGGGITKEKGFLQLAEA